MSASKPDTEKWSIIDLLKHTKIGQLVAVIAAVVTVISGVFGFGFWIGSTMEDISLQKLELEIARLEDQLTLEQQLTFQREDYTDAMRTKAELLSLLYDDLRNQIGFEQFFETKCTADECNCDAASRSQECWKVWQERAHIHSRSRDLYYELKAQQSGQYANRYMDLGVDKNNQPLLRLDDGTVLRFPGLIELEIR